jgi:hypothetical protein
MQRKTEQFNDKLKEATKKQFALTVNLANLEKENTNLLYEKDKYEKAIQAAQYTIDKLNETVSKLMIIEGD